MKKQLSNTHKGQILEQEFVIECIKRNIILSQPTAATKYDFLLDNGKRFLKLQLKSAVPSGPNLNSFIINTKSHGRSYKHSEVDFFVTKINDEWYFLPHAVVRSTAATLNITSTDGTKYSQFRNSWTTLGVSGSSAQSGLSQISLKQRKASLKYQKSQPLSSRQNKNRYQSR